MMSITRIAYNPVTRKTAVRFRQGVRGGFQDIGQDLRRKFRRKIIDGPKTGRLYKRSGRKHRASAPGQPPANWTGNLQRTTKYEIKGADTLEVGYTAEYGDWLETGTQNIAPRPNIVPTVMENTAQIRVYFNTNILRKMS